MSENTTVFLFEKLINAEAENNLFEYRIAGIPIWEYVRFHCITLIMGELIGFETGIGKKEASLPKEYTKDSRIKEWYKRCQFLVHRKELLVVNHPRRVKVGKYYQCFVTDEILRNLDYSYYVYEYAYRGGHFTPTSTKGLKYINLNILSVMIKNKNSEYVQQANAFVRRVIEIFENVCGAVFTTELKKQIASVVKNIFCGIFCFKVWANIILTLVRPKCVITTSSYDALIQTLICEAKKREIPTIELQHGRIGNIHTAYNYIYKGELESFSDYMFVYGDYDKQAARFPIDDEHVIAVGYPELEKRAEYYAKRGKRSRKKVMIFISSMLDGKVVSDYAVNLRKRKELENVRMIYKLHPAEYSNWQKLYPNLAGSGLEVVSDNNHDIYYFLGHSDYVVGISSTVLFEAMKFQCNIFIIQAFDYRKAEYVYSSGAGELVTCEDDIVKEICNGENLKKKPDADDYFKNNAMENVKREIDRIIAASSQ